LNIQATLRVAVGCESVFGCLVSDVTLTLLVISLRSSAVNNGNEEQNRKRSLLCRTICVSKMTEMLDYYMTFEIEKISLDE
jgi:hypothetical protein